MPRATFTGGPLNGQTRELPPSIWEVGTYLEYAPDLSNREWLSGRILGAASSATTFRYDRVNVQRPCPCGRHPEGHISYEWVHYA